jgi:quercetin dioxygenase-like cupin family protein
MRSPRKLALVAAAAMGVVLLAPTAAMATPPVGVTATIIYQKTVGDTDYILREITIQPGGTTGWHWHEGTLYGVIKSGTLTHEMSDCTTIETYRPRQPITEESGAEHAHRGVNLGDTPLVLDVLYVNPKGAPLSDDAADPGCPVPG